MMRCIIIDDERLAVDLMENNVSRVPFLQLVGKFSNPYEAVSFMQQNPVDLLFIDIEMPGLTGLEMLSSMKAQLQVVIVSAYQQYALAGFNLDVTDYLLKPVSFERFFKACLKCQQNFNASATGRAPAPELDYFFVNVDYAQVKINCQEIMYIEAMRDYVKIFFKNEKPVVTRISLKSIEAKLDPGQFLRIHKSFIVNTATILSIRKGVVSLEGYDLPLSENYREAVVRRLRISN